MPAFFTHYRFGIDCYKALSKGFIRNAIHAHPHAYCLGTQGPDVFFYSLEELCSKEENYGSRLHKENTGAFLYALITEAFKTENIEEKQIKLAYTVGFLTHYFLDCNIHGYVYSRAGVEKTKKTTGQHYELEADIDLRVLEMLDRKTPDDYSQPYIISLTKEEQQAIGMLLSATVPQTLRGVRLSQRQAIRVLKDMQLVLGLFQDRKGIKGKVSSFVEKKVFGHVYGSPLLCNSLRGSTEDACNESHCKWINPYGEDSSTQSVFDLMEQAKEEFLTTEKILERIFDGHELGRKDISDEIKENLSKQIGNRSYKSGYELN